MDEKKLYQHGSLALLVPGMLDGTMTLQKLLEQGNTGIGTGEGLDGELIILDGIAYHVCSDGTVRIAEKTLTVPYANCHFANFIDQGILKQLAMKACYESIYEVLSPNLFYAVKIEGIFSCIETRAVRKQNKPYPGLKEAITQQKIFRSEYQRGTAIGYFSPKLYQGISTPGFHLHFINDERNFGGHILDFSLTEGHYSIQIFNRLEQSFPAKSCDFLHSEIIPDVIMQELAILEN